MKINLPVTQVEKPYPHGQYLVSKTDLKGSITYANDAFVDLSGFTRNELIGKSHNLVRHPDMPPQAFDDLWRTVKKGLPWRGIVKNRAKNGDHYWVDAFVVPIRKNGQTIGYMSVRSEPSRNAVRQAEELYRRLNETKAALPAAGGWLRNLSIRSRLVMVVSFLALVIAGGAVVGIGGQWMSNQALGSVYQDKLEPATRLGRLMLLLGDNRSQIMLGLQHNPTNPLAHLHDHPLSMHIDATLKNQDEINRLLDEIQRHPLTPEEKALADKFKETRGRFAREGVNPAREALKAGEYNRANEILLASINPLFKQVAADGDALLKEMLDSTQREYEREQGHFRLMLILSIGGTLVALLLAGVGAGCWCVPSCVPWKRPSTTSTTSPRAI
jgi:PAS domain S-box